MSDFACRKLQWYRVRHPVVSCLPLFCRIHDQIKHWGLGRAYCLPYFGRIHAQIEYWGFGQFHTSQWVMHKAAAFHCPNQATFLSMIAMNTVCVCFARRSSHLRQRPYRQCCLKLVLVIASGFLQPWQQVAKGSKSECQTRRNKIL